MKITKGATLLLSAVACLSMPCLAQVRPILQAPRVEPVAPRSGEQVVFRLDEDVCGYLRNPLSIQVSGNVVSIVESFRRDPDGGCFEPFPLPYDYSIGRFSEGEYIARYTAIRDNAIIFGPADVAFTVAGAPRSIPTLDGVGMLLLALAISVVTISVRHRTVGNA